MINDAYIFREKLFGLREPFIRFKKIRHLVFFFFSYLIPILKKINKLNRRS